MKASEYNYIINKEENSYWYNGIEHTYFRLPIDLGHKIQDLLASNESIKRIPEVLKRKMIDNGFIISNHVDEISIIRKRNNEKINKKDYFLILLPTLNCNFNCWYCIQSHIPSKMSEKTMEAVKSHIKYMIEVEKIESLQIEWFGGEPLIYLKQVIQPICEYAQNKCKEYNIKYITTATTNGFFLLPDSINIIKQLEFRRFQITLDGPKSEHDKVKYQGGCNSAFEHVLQNIDYMLSNTDYIRILLRINYTDENLSYRIVDEVNNIISFPNRHKMTITPKKVWQESVRKSRYNSLSKLLDLFDASGYKTARLDVTNDFIPCYANRKYYNAINYNADVIKCTACNDLYENKAHGTIKLDGSIAWDNDFISKYEAKSFENEKCLSCKKLPICMGVCPRDYGQSNLCKFDGMDINLDESIVSHIEAMYK